MSLRNLARMLADSPFLAKGKAIWDANQKSWEMPLSRTEKLLAGAHLILSDYADNRFPPTFEDQQRAYDGEINYRDALPGHSPEQTSKAELRKPYWFGKQVRHYLRDLSALVGDFEAIGIRPPQRLLELGSGAGWLAQALAEFGFDVVGTSIAPADITDANRRIESLAVKGLDPKLQFRVAPMETANEAVKDLEPFDAVLVYEALHHAYDWRAAFSASLACLKPGGWFLILGEPNLIHTFVSYRIARLSNTHEIGLSRTKMCEHLEKVGFTNIRILRHRFHFGVRSHWIAAQRPL
jgi:SAM-dependent methyltransferase